MKKCLLSFVNFSELIWLQLQPCHIDNSQSYKTIQNSEVLKMADERRTLLLGRTAGSKGGLGFFKAVCIFTIFIIIALGVFRLLSQESDDISLPNTSPSTPGVLKASLNQNDPEQEEENSKILTLEGEPIIYKELNLTQLSSQSQGITQLTLKYLLIDPASFTDLLNASDSFRSLKSIRIEKVKVIAGKPWNFTRVYLPNLENFVMDLDVGFRDQYTEYMKEISEKGLLNLLFYDKTETENVVNLGEKISTEGVQLLIRYDGWNVISATRAADARWDVILAVEFAESVLKNISSLNIGHLTMTECSTSLSAIPNGLQYLNLYRVPLLDGENIMSYFTSFPYSNLTELYFEERNATLKLSGLPKSVKTLAIGDVLDSKYVDGDGLPGVEYLGLGFPLDEKIIEHFHKIFNNVKSVGVFEPTDGIQHLLLKNVMKTNATWILMEGFNRVKGANGSEIELEMEKLLQNCGVPENERNFLLFQDMKTLSWYEMSMTKEQKLKYRYDILGWNGFISWDMYMKNF